MKILGYPFFYGYFPSTIKGLGISHGACKMFLVQLIPSVLIWIVLIKILNFTFGITTIKEILLGHLQDKMGWDKDRNGRGGLQRCIEWASEFFISSWQLLPFLVPLWFRENGISQHWSIELGAIILSAAIMTVYWTLISIGLIKFALPIVIAVIAYLIIRAVQKYCRSRAKS